MPFVPFPVLKDDKREISRSPCRSRCQLYTVNLKDRKKEDEYASKAG
jgi:hypothetical protein